MKRTHKSLRYVLNKIVARKMQDRYMTALAARLKSVPGKL